ALSIYCRIGVIRKPLRTFRSDALARLHRKGFVLADCYHFASPQGAFQSRESTASTSARLGGTQPLWAQLSPATTAPKRRVRARSASSSAASAPGRSAPLSPSHVS